MTEELIGRLGYVGVTLVLVLGGLGLPVPEEAPIILAAVLTRTGRMIAPLALASCFAGVLLGDFVVYFLGYFQGEKVMNWRLTRRLLTRQREAQIKGYFHRHGFKILVSGRFVPGFRTAAYLTAGILKLPPLKLLVTDLIAASLSTSLMFGLGFLFAHEIQKGIREAERWVAVVLAVVVGGWLLYRYYKARRRAGLPVGPLVSEADEVPLPEPRGPLAAPPETRSHTAPVEHDREPASRPAATISGPMGGLGDREGSGPASDTRSVAVPLHERNGPGPSWKEAELSIESEAEADRPSAIGPATAPATGAGARPQAESGGERRKLESIRPRLG